MRYCVVSDTKVGTGTPAAGAGLLLQNPQQAAGLWLGDPPDFGDTLPATEGVGLRLIDPQGLSGLILGTPPYEVTSPIPVEAPTIFSVNQTGPTSAEVFYIDNQTVASDSFNVYVTEHGVGEISGSPFSTTDNPYAITGLTASTLYTVYVTAVVGGLESGPSSIENVTTADAGEPGDFIPTYVHIKFNEGPQDADAQTQLGAPAGDAFDGLFSNLPRIKYDNFSSPSSQSSQPTSPVVGAYGCKCIAVEKSPIFGGTVNKTKTYANFQFLEEHEGWFKCSLWIPSDFVWWSENGQTKLFRAVMGTDSGGGKGNLDIGISNGGSGIELSNGEVWTYSSYYPTRTYLLAVADHRYPVNTGPDVFTIPRDQWVDFEFYTYFSADPTKGKMRMYIDKQKVFDTSDTQQCITLSRPADWCEMWRFCTAWNGLASDPGSPLDQEMWIDNIVITDHTNPPQQTASDGTLIIGDWTG